MCEKLDIGDFMQKTIRNLLLIAITLFVCNIGKVDALETSARCVYEYQVGNLSPNITIDILPLPDNNNQYGMQVDPGLSWNIAGIFDFNAPDVTHMFYLSLYNFVTDDGLLTCPNTLYLQGDKGNNYYKEVISYYASKDEVKPGQKTIEATLVEKQSSAYTARTFSPFENMCRYDMISINYNSDKNLHISSIPIVVPFSNELYALNLEINLENTSKNFPDTCPSSIYVSDIKDLKTTISLNPQDGYHEVTLSPVRSATELGFNSNIMINKPNPQEYSNCSLFGDGALSSIIKWIIDIMQMMVPIIIIILTIVDFSSIVLSGEEKNFKAAGTKFVKRLVIGVAIIFLPMLLTFIIDLSGVLGPITRDQLFCSLF